MNQLDYATQKQIKKLFDEIEALETRLKFFKGNVEYSSLIKNIKKNIEQKQQEIANLREYGSD